MTATIQNLEACEFYIFAVGVYGEYGAGPLSQLVTVATQWNNKAPPKKLRANRGDKVDSMVVSWTPSCDTKMIDEKVGYTVSIFIAFIEVNLQKK